MSMGIAGRVATIGAIAAVGAGAGAGIAALTNTKNEGRQTFVSTLVGAGAIAAGYGLMKMPGADGNLVGALLGVLVMGAGIAASGAAVGSYLVDRGNG